MPLLKLGFIDQWRGNFGFIRPDDENLWRQESPEIYNLIDAYCRAKNQPLRVYFNFLDIDDDRLTSRLNSLVDQSGAQDVLVEFELKETIDKGQLTFKAINVRSKRVKAEPNGKGSSLPKAKYRPAASTEVTPEDKLESQKAAWTALSLVLKEADELRLKAKDSRLTEADRVRYWVDLIRHLERYPILFDSSALASQVREIDALSDPEIEFLRLKYSKTERATIQDGSLGSVNCNVRGRGALDLTKEEFARIEPFMSSDSTVAGRFRSCWAEVRQAGFLWRDIFEPAIGDLQSSKRVSNDQCAWALRAYVLSTLLSSRFPGRHMLHVNRANCARVVARHYASADDLPSSARWLLISYFANRSAIDLVARSDESQVKKYAGIMSAILAEESQESNRLPALAAYWRKRSGFSLQPLSRLSLTEANLLYSKARIEWEDAPLTATDRLLHVLSCYPDNVHAIRLLPKTAGKANVLEETLALIDDCIPASWLENRLTKALLYEMAANQADAADRLRFLQRCDELLRVMRNHDPGHPDIAELQVRIDHQLGTLADRPLPIPGLIGGKYEQDKNTPMRTGMFGRCYRVTNVREGKYYFVKEFDPAYTPRPPEEVRQQARREFRAGKSTNHPSIARALELVDDKYLVMQWIDGVDLIDFMKDDSVSFRFPGRQVALAGTQLCDALDHLGKVWPREIVNPRLPNLRSEDMAHGDIRPQNIRYTKSKNTFVLIDFTLARLDDVATVPSALIAGISREEYRAPEQFETSGHRRNCLTDIYSLGMVLYRLYTGSFPYRENPVELLQSIEDPPQPIPPSKAISQLATNLGVAIPGNYVIKELDEILCRMIQVEPRKRYRCPSEARDKFSQLLGRNHAK